jgi:hypothetical protein
VPVVTNCFSLQTRGSNHAFYPHFCLSRTTRCIPTRLPCARRWPSLLRRYASLRQLPGEGFVMYVDSSACNRCRFQNGFETKFPRLAELACKNAHWAVKNLIRRQVVDSAEYAEEFHGKTASGWASYHGNTVLAQELKYYVSRRSEHYSCSNPTSPLLY